MTDARKSRSNSAGLVRQQDAALRDANDMPSRLAGENLARERRFASKLEDARQVALRMSQAAAERERGLAAKLHDAQQIALRMSQTAAERVQKLADELHESRERAALQARDAESRIRDLQARLRQRLQEFARITREQETGTMPPFRPSKTGRYHLSNFDACQGEAFVHAAYQALLRRAPDPDGFKYYRARLNQGIAKVQILGEILYSPEGKAAGAVVDGLAVPFAIAKAIRWPVIGGLLKFIEALWNLQDSARRQRALENQLARLREEVSNQAQRNAALLDRMLRAIESEAEL